MEKGRKTKVGVGAREGRGRRREMTESRGGEGHSVSPTHHVFNVHINTRSGKETFHTSSMTSTCSKV